MRTLETEHGAEVLRKHADLPVATLPAILGGGFLLAGLLVALTRAFGFSPAFPLLSASLYLCIVLLVLRGLRQSYPHAAFGLANGVTLLRALLACLFAGLALDLALQPGTPEDAVAWCFLAIGAVALALDGLDGFLARRRGTGSAFGARFDMEVDALLILLLSLLAWQLGKAGGWILLAGALRYLFIATTLLWPRLAAPLPQLWRRKAICVVQGLVLCALLAPPLGPPASSLLAEAALALLVYSFAADVWLLLRRTPP